MTVVLAVTGQSVATAQAVPMESLRGAPVETQSLHDTAAVERELDRLFSVYLIEQSPGTWVVDAGAARRDGVSSTPWAT